MKSSINKWHESHYNTYWLLKYRIDKVHLNIDEVQDISIFYNGKTLLTNTRKKRILLCNYDT